MKDTYLILLFDKGEGCDYTIGCNRTSRIFKCEKTELIIQLKKIVEEYGEDWIDHWNIYEIPTEVLLPYAEFRAKMDKIHERWAKDQKKQSLQEQITQLQKELDQFKESE